MLKVSFLKTSILLTFFCLVSCTQATENIDGSLNNKSNSIKECSRDFSTDKFHLNELKYLLECNYHEDGLAYLRYHKDNLSVEDDANIGFLLYEKYSNEYYSIPYLEIASLYDHREATYLLAYIYTFSKNNKNISRAIELYKKSIKLGYYDSYFMLGGIYLEQEKYKNIDIAEEYFYKALEKGDFLAYYGLGSISLERKQYEKAIEYFNLASKYGYIFDANVGFLNLYMYYPDFKGHNPDKAKEYLDLILKEDDNQKNIIASEFYAEKGQYYNKELSDYYMKLAEKNEPHKQYK